MGMTKYVLPLGPLGPVWLKPPIEVGSELHSYLHHYRRHIGDLWDHIERLDELIFQSDDFTIKKGDASVVLKKDGTIMIKGNNINIEGRGRIDIKSAGDVTIKGARILQN
jgi:hypothetical protein